MDQGCNDQLTSTMKICILSNVDQLLIGLVKTESGFIVRSLETGLER